MKTYQKIWGAVAVLLAVIVSVAAWYLHRHTIPVLQPAGPIGEKERNLMIFTVLISMVVVVPVFFMLGFFAWKYREGNVKATYSPELEGNRVAETYGGLVPAVIIAYYCTVVTWRSSYALDPFKPLSS